MNQCLGCTNLPGSGATAQPRPGFMMDETASPGLLRDVLTERSRCFETCMYACMYVCMYIYIYLYIYDLYIYRYICFSRKRSEEFPFIVGGLGVGAVFASFVLCRRGVVMVSSWSRRGLVVVSSWCRRQFPAKRESSRRRFLCFSAFAP